MFINFTNHPSTHWGDRQIEEANKYGEIKDLPFPAVGPSLCTDEVIKMAEDYASQIKQMTPDVVLVQGEMSLCYHVVDLLKKANIKVLCACSKRVSTESVDANGHTVKQSLFKFVQFREY